MTDGAAGGASMVDAQFSTVRVLRPFAGFESIYQGVPGQVPIAFPGTPDPRAGNPGYSPNLLGAIPMPIGARVKIWFPVTWTPREGVPGEVDETDYRFRLMWRYRTVGDFRDPAPGIPRPPWSLAIQGAAAPEGAPGAEEARFIIPAAWHVSAFEQTEPVAGNGSIHMRVEEVVPREIFDPAGTVNNLIPPLLPGGGIGIVQQGVLNPTTAGPASFAPGFVAFDTEAQGNELLIFANRFDPTSDWDFTSAALDLPFGNVFGTGNGAHAEFPNNGIYVVTGSAP